MKKLLIITSLILLASCSLKEQDNGQDKEYTMGMQYPAKRIKVLEQSTFLTLYEVDGHEYIVNFNGGIAHSESCPCKNKK